MEVRQAKDLEGLDRVASRADSDVPHAGLAWVLNQSLNMNNTLHRAKDSKVAIGKADSLGEILKSIRPRTLWKLPDQLGSSLVEIMIAVLILSFVGIGMAEFFANGRVGFDRQEHKRLAVLLAQEALERTVVQPYPQIGPWSEQRSIDSMDYTITVSTLPDVPEPGLKTVQSDVTWPAGPSDTQTVSLVTFVNAI